jgi:hypothetical protein
MKTYIGEQIDIFKNNVRDWIKDTNSVYNFIEILMLQLIFVIGH